jgi:hypothetical protein
MSTNQTTTLNILSRHIVYSEHDYDECFEYKDGSGRVPDGIAIGYEQEDHDLAGPITKLFLFQDIKYSEHDHQYWDNYELENDVDRIVIS